MASNGSFSSPRVGGGGGGDSESSLEKIKRQLTSGSGRNLLQGPLLKRSETLRKWNERWAILDPSTGKFEYKTRRNESTVKGTIVFDANSTVTISPVNFHGLPKYENCCLYIGTSQKKEYFLCAETPSAARAWVSTLHATQLVLRAHKEAVNSLSGNGSAKLGTVATVVAAANSTALESSKEIEAAMKLSMRSALGMMVGKSDEGPMDDMTIMKETLRVKDEELQQLARDIRTRDSTIKELAEKLTNTAEAAEAAASAVHSVDEQRQIACGEIERLTIGSKKQLESCMMKLRDSEILILHLNKQRDDILKQRDSAIQETQLWRSELAKARERVVILEGAVVRAEERVRVADADAEAKIKRATEKELAAIKEKDKLLAYVEMLQTQVQRQQKDTQQVFQEKIQSCSDVVRKIPTSTKDVNLSEENVDKACLSISKRSSESLDRDNISSISKTDDDGQWSDIRATDGDGVIDDVREITPEAEGNSLDIPVSGLTVEGSSFHQP